MTTTHDRFRVDLSDAPPWRLLFERRWSLGPCTWVNALTYADALDPGRPGNYTRSWMFTVDGPHGWRLRFRISRTI